ASTAYALPAGRPRPSCARTRRDRSSFCHPEASTRDSLSTAPKKDTGDFPNPSLNPSAVQRRKFRIGRSRTGLGLFATKPYRKREYVVTYRGRKLANAEADRLEARGSRYMFEINSRWTIDGSARWNTARYVNHSCRPNVEAIERRGGKIVYIARRRI